MPAIMTDKEVFTFDELSDEAKEKAREWMRDLEQVDFDPCFEPFETAAKILGIEFNNASQKGFSPDIRYSGFYSQGDGASFVGAYSHAPGASAKIREEFPDETRLHEIADGLTSLQVGHRILTGHWINAKIECSGREVHEYAMDITAEDSESGEEFDWYGEVTKGIKELMRDFARWIYKSLEEEYDYRLSDEAIDESLSGREFDEDGEEV